MLAALPIAILALLAYGSITDIRTRTVPNKITGSIIVLSLPLIYLNLQYITAVHALAIALITATYTFKGLGGADLKAMVPILLSSNIYQFLLLFGGSLIVGAALMLNYRGKVPFFVAITAGYAITLI